MKTNFTITCTDGQKLTAVKYNPNNIGNKKLVVVNSALGVKQSFYEPLATYLTKHGFTVITWDPRGIGLSSQKDIKNDRAKLREWGQIDLTALLDQIVEKQWTDWHKITLIGHSAGGHLIGLCPRIKQIKKVILICSGTCAWHLYPTIHQPKMLFAWCVLFPFLYKTIGYVPDKFGLGHALPKGIAKDWRKWSLNKNYLFGDNSLGEHFYASYEGQIEAIGFSDDYGFSPKKTIYDLVERFTLAHSKIEIFEPCEFNRKSIGHFGVFKASNEHIWQKLILSKLT